MNPGPSLLFVEDDEDLRSILAENLQDAGYRVTAVGTALAFFQELSKGGHRLALIDLGLPDESGEVLVSYTRRNTAIPIIVLTARDTLETRIATYKLGAHLFLGKPAQSAELVAAVGSLLAAPAAPAPAPGGGWHLSVSTRVLSSPGGGRVELSGSEFELLRCLTRSTETFPHEKLIGELYHRNDPSAGKALEIRIRRARQRISAVTGERVPILNHYGVGYAFAGVLTVE